MKEQDIARAVVAWLREQHWETYQEVSPRRQENRADIVAVRGNLIWVIETKEAFTFNVVAQALNWKPYAHWVSVAVPQFKKGGHTVRHVQGQLLSMLGIGGILVNPKHAEIDTWMAPVMNRRVIPVIMPHLQEHGQHLKDQPGGVAGGGYWTPFKQTCHELTDYVAKHQGCSMKDALAHVKHHYHRESTALSCMMKNVRDGLVPGITLKQEGRKLFLHYNRSKR